MITKAPYAMPLISPRIYQKQFSHGYTGLFRMTLVGIIIHFSVSTLPSLFLLLSLLNYEFPVITGIPAINPGRHYLSFHPTSFLCGLEAALFFASFIRLCCVGNNSLFCAINRCNFFSSVLRSLMKILNQIGPQPQFLFH